MEHWVADLAEGKLSGFTSKNLLIWWWKKNVSNLRMGKTRSTELWLSASPGKFTQRLRGPWGGEPHFHGVVREKSELGTF